MLFNTNIKNERLYLRVTQLEKDKLQEISKKEGLTLTKFILKCINFYLENKEN